MTDPGPQPAPALEADPSLVGVPGTPAGGAPPAVSRVNGRDASAVSRTVAVIWWTRDTEIDESGWDALMRAAPFLEPGYLKLQRGNPPRRSPGGEWMEWAAHRAYTTVEASPADEFGKPTDTPLQAFRMWKVVPTVHGRDGWKPPPADRIVYVTLVRSDPNTDWKVSGVEYR